MSQTPLLNKLTDYAQLMRLHRPVGIYLLLWPTLWALWLAADGWPGWHLLLVFVLGTVLMRSAGCAINDYADRHFDPHVARTRDRPLAAGRIAPSEALRLFVVVSLIAFGLLSSLHNLQAIWLSLPALLLAGAYPFAKRHLDIPQAILGLAFSAGIPMAFVAVRHSVDWPLALSLIAANLLWVIAYDTYYAMTDREDDLKIGVRSSAILFGRHDRLITALTQLLSLLILLGVGLRYGLGPWFHAGLAVAALCALYEQWLIRAREPQACFRAFLHAHYSGLAIWLGLVLDRL